MSYCRFSDGDVYLFRHVGGYFQCCACSLAPLVNTLFSAGGSFMGVPVEPCKACGGGGCSECQMHDNTNMKTAVETLKHLNAHVRAGHRVPRYALKRLRAEVKQERSNV